MTKMTIKQYREMWKSKGLCQDCGTEPTTTFRCEICRAKHKIKNNEFVAANKEKLQARYEARRIEVLSHYGLNCICCGEGNTRFLTLDHVNNDGYLHRKGMRVNICRWAKVNNYPDTLQTMCFNCNLGKAHNGGVCPHSTLLAEFITKAIAA